MSIFTFYNCIVAAAVACIFSSLLDGAKPQRAAGVLGVVCYSLKRFKAVLRAFRRLGYKYTIMTQKRKNGACRHLKRLYITVRHIQAKQKTATAAGLLSGLYYIVLRTTKHSFDKYLWLIVSNTTIYCGMENREKLRCVCHFWDFQYTDRLTGEVFIYGKKFFKKKYPKKSRMCVSFLRNRQNNLRDRGENAEKERSFIMRELKELLQAADWTAEVAKYKPIIKDMKVSEADNFLWKEYYFNKKLSKRAYNWLSMWTDEICMSDD